MADVANSLNSWSSTASSNSPNDNTTIGSGLADNLQAIQAVVRGDLASKGADIASSAAPDVGAVVGLYHDITGSNTITGLGSSATAGIWKIFQTDSAPVFKHSTAMAMPRAADYTAVTGNVLAFLCEASNQWRCMWISPDRSASSDVAGAIELATTAETLAGTDSSRAITPLAMASVMGIVKLASGSFSSTSVGDISLASYTAYNTIKIKIRRAFPATDGALLRMRTSTDGGTTYDSGVSDYARSNFGVDNLSATTAEGNDGTTSLEITPSFSSTTGIGSASTEGADAEITLMDRLNTSRFCQVQWRGSYITARTITGSVSFAGSGCRQAAGDVDAVRFFMSSGNISSMNYEVFGEI